MTVWPNFFIAGAPRCGTTSLHAWLQTIPGIYMSRIKEPNFFSRQVIADDHPLLKPIRGEKQYLQLFSAAGDAKIVGEASRKYLEDPGAPALIDRTVPGAKILVSLRDPVERYHSNYLMIRNNRPSMGSLMSEIERGIAHEDNPSLPIVPPRTGLYAAHIERYRPIFGSARVPGALLPRRRRPPGAARPAPAMAQFQRRLAVAEYRMTDRSPAELHAERSIRERQRRPAATPRHTGMRRLNAVIDSSNARSGAS